MLKKDDLDASILITSKNNFAIPKIVNNFKDNKSKHEIIIVGPMPNYNVGNLKIINSYNKPPQCHTIAFKEARGKFISLFSDDIFFNKRRSLDKLINLTKKNKKKLISLRLTNPLNKNINSYRFHPDINDSKLIPVAPLIDREIIKKIGLFDRRFTATLYDVDLYLRLMKYGYKTIFSNVYLTENHFNKYSLNQDYSYKDRKLLNDLWTKKTFKGKKTLFGDKIYLQMRNYRADKLQKYNLQELKRPQGNLGRWKFNNQIYFFLANRLYFFIFKIVLNIPYFQSKLYYIYRKYFKSKFQK